jgi:hypothetical protein
MVSKYLRALYYIMLDCEADNDVDATMEVLNAMVRIKGDGATKVALIEELVKALHD